MPYRREVVTNERGESEMFLVRIGSEAVAEWLAQRDQLREAGSPDRPPDVDTETLRGWIQHPGEEDHPYFAGTVYTRMPVAEGGETNERNGQRYVAFVASFVHAEAGEEVARVRVSVEAGDDATGGYVLRFTMWQKGEEPQDTAHAWAADSPDDLVNADLQHLLELGSIFEDAKITLPSDIDALDTEYEAAFEDLDALYGDAGEAPESGIVQ